MSGPYIDLGPGGGMSDEDQTKLDSLLDVESGLSDREIEFLDSIDKKRDRPLTEKQANWLDSIYERLC